MTKVESSPLDKTIPEALSDWRVAIRGVEASEATKILSDKLLVIATEAENAALNVEESTTKAEEAVRAARNAAHHARSAAVIARELATLTKISAEGDVARAEQSVVDAKGVEKAAHDKFKHAQDDKR